MERWPDEFFISPSLKIFVTKKFEFNRINIVLMLMQEDYRNIKLL